MRYLRSKKLKDNPARDVAANNRPARLDEQKYVTLPQFRAVLNAAAADKGNFARERDHCAIFCGFYMALRVGEAATLNVKSFRHLGRGIVYVSRLKKRGDNPEVRLPYMEPQAVEYLKGYLQELRPGQEWLFEPHRRPGDHISPWTLNQAFATYASAAGLDAEYSWHALRHGRGMQLWSKFRDLKVVADFLGHSNVMTASIYVHLDPAQRQERSEKLAEDWVEVKRP
jgi:integrase